MEVLVGDAYSEVIPKRYLLWSLKKVIAMVSFHYNVFIYLKVTKTKTK